MSKNINYDSEIVGDGYIAPTFSKAYIPSHTLVNYLYGNAQEELDTVAKCLGNLENFSYSEIQASGIQDTLSLWFGDTSLLYTSKVISSGYPAAIPSSLSNGIQMLQVLIGNINYPSISGYWDDTTNQISFSEYTSITEEISRIESKSIGLYLLSGETHEVTFDLYPPESGLAQCNWIEPILPGYLGGQPPMTDIIGIGSTGYGRAASLSGVILDSINGTYTGTGSTYINGSGIWPVTIDERLNRLNEASNYLKNLLIQRVSLNNPTNVIGWNTPNITKTLTVPNGINVDSLTFELWGAGGGGGRAIAIYDATGYITIITDPTAVAVSTGTAGAPGSFIKFTVTGFNPGDIFSFRIGSGGYARPSILHNWHAYPHEYPQLNSFSGGDSYIDYRNIKTGLTHRIAFCPGGQGGYGGWGRVTGGASTEWVNGPSVSTPSFVLNHPLGSNLSLIGEVELNTGVSTTYGNSGFAWATVSQGNPFPFKHSNRFANGYIARDYCAQQWYSGGQGIANNGYGDGGTGGDGISTWGGSSLIREVVNPTNGANGMFRVFWPGYSYLPNPGGKDSRWLRWQENW